MGHPVQVPPELIAHILSHLGARTRDLLPCSLVCRDWLPLARSHLRLTIHTIKASRFLELAASPLTTIVGPIQNLCIFSVSSRPLFLMLGQFVSLRSLELRFVDPETTDLPVLPRVESLRLHYTTFPSCAEFIAFLAKLPALRHLQIDCVLFTTPPEDGDYTFPPLDLQSLALDCDSDTPAMLQALMNAVRTRKLTLTASDKKPPPGLISALSDHLRAVGSHLTSLEINYAAEHLASFAPVDFSHSTGLKHLAFKAGVALAVPRGGTAPVVNVHPALLALLPSIAAHAPLHALTLTVYADTDRNPRWSSLTQFAALLQTGPLTRVRTIQCRVRCSPFGPEGFATRARDLLEPLLRAEISCADGREIVFLENEGADLLLSQDQSTGCVLQQAADEIVLYDTKRGVDSTE
ncbi:hypothetical protein DFH06DRAFT_1466302 [Mycena polygramma]|nr:hypothetical protein DFH06DRAFT_1466302 [Mycena polygramma]